MRNSFPTKPEYLDLIPVLAQTALSKDLDGRSYTSDFGQVHVRLYGAQATVTYLGPVHENLAAYVPPSGLRASLIRLGLVPSPTLGRSVIGHRGRQFTESHSQEIGLRFANGVESKFDARQVRSTGLPFKINDYLTVILASTGADLVLFAFKWGTQWIWLYGDMSSRLEAAGVCAALAADERFNSVAGMVHVTLR